MMAVSERRERAADILADGLVKLLKRQPEPSGSDKLTEEMQSDTGKVLHLELVKDDQPGDRR